MSTATPCAVAAGQTMVLMSFGLDATCARGGSMGSALRLHQQRQRVSRNTNALIAAPRKANSRSKWLSEEAKSLQS